VVEGSLWCDKDLLEESHGGSVKAEFYIGIFIFVKETVIIDGWGKDFLDDKIGNDISFVDGDGEGSNVFDGDC
jgi:hypothetical protein